MLAQAVKASPPRRLRRWAGAKKRSYVRARELKAAGMDWTEVYDDVTRFLAEGTAKTPMLALAIGADPRSKRATA